MICARVIGPYGSCPTTGGCPCSEPALGVEPSDSGGLAERLGLAGRCEVEEAAADGVRETATVGSTGFFTPHRTDEGVEAVAVGVAGVLAAALADVVGL
jgi:hypothetical protein